MVFFTIPTEVCVGIRIQARYVHFFHFRFLKKKKKQFRNLDENNLNDLFTFPCMLYISNLGFIFCCCCVDLMSLHSVMK
jgi:hypothetical protein